MDFEAKAEEIAGAWLNDFEPPPQITFTQAYTLEDRIAAALREAEHEACERAIERMGWPEIHAFENEFRRGQSVYEDAGGFFLRAFRRLFGLPPRDEVVTYQQAARAALREAEQSGCERGKKEVAP